METLPGPVAALDDVTFAQLTCSLLWSLLTDIKSCRVSPNGGVTFPGGRWNMRSLKDHPAEPATLTVGNALGGIRFLYGDFDVSKAEAAGVPDPVAQVARDAAGFVALVRRCGGRAVVHDISPSGGRHVIVKFAQAVPAEDMARLGRALGARFLTYDKAPVQNPAGQLRPPGSVHKRTIAVFNARTGKADRLTGPITGFHTLTMPLTEAVEAMRRPCPMSVWERLEVELRAELRALDAAVTFDASGEWSTDLAGQPWLEPRYGRRALPPLLAELATTGVHQPAYLTPSEARLAVFNAAAGAGWRLAELLAEARPGGMFPGLAKLLGTGGTRVLTHDWAKAVRGVANFRAALGSRFQTGHNLDTSLKVPPPPRGAVGALWQIPGALAEAPAVSRSVWQELYGWAGACWYAERDPVRSKGWGRGAVSVRLVLRALLVEARMTGGLIVGFGVRNTGLTGGRGRQTVADVLVRLREEDDPLIDLVAKGTGEDPDVYRLRIPEAYRGQALSRPWRAGRIEAGHPVFLHLGGVAGLVYEALSSVPARPTELERAVVLSSSAVSAALRHLAEVGLAEKAVDDDGTRGWRRGPATLDEVAARGDVQADDLFAERVRIVQAERREYREFLRLMGDPAHWRGVAERALAEQAAGEQEPDAPAVVDLTAHDTGGPRPDWVPADAVQDWVTTGDPLAWVTPQHEAAMAQLAELGRTHPQAARLRDRPPPPPRRARPRPAPRPRPGPGSTADPPPLVPMPAAQMAQLLADNPVLQLLADELGAIVLTHGPPEG